MRLALFSLEDHIFALSINWGIANPLVEMLLTSEHHTLIMIRVSGKGMPELYLVPIPCHASVYARLVAEPIFYYPAKQSLWILANMSISPSIRHLQSWYRTLALQCGVTGAEH